MLNILFRILTVVAVFVMTVLLIGTLLPRGFETTSSVKIDASPEVIFRQINVMKYWSNWSMWNEHDISGLRVDYSGPASGVGAMQKWTELRGEGKLRITESVPNQELAFVSSFSNFPEMDSQIVLTADGSTTNVVWTSVGTLPSGPFYGWFGITFGDSLAVEYKKALERLKRVCEQETKLNQAGEKESSEKESSEKESSEKESSEKESSETEKATSSG